MNAKTSMERETAAKVSRCCSYRSKMAIKTMNPTGSNAHENARSVTVN